MQSIHVVVRIMPDKYIHTHSCRDDIAEHRHPTFRTWIPRQVLQWFKDEIGRHHGDAVTIKQHDEDDADLTLAYSQRHFIDSGEVMVFEEWVRGLLSRAKSTHVLPKPVTRC